MGGRHGFKKALALTVLFLSQLHVKCLLLPSTVHMEDLIFQSTKLFIHVNTLIWSKSGKSARKMKGWLITESTCFFLSFFFDVSSIRVKLWVKQWWTEKRSAVLTIFISSESQLFRSSLCHGFWSPGSLLTLVLEEPHRDPSVSYPDTSLWLDQRLITPCSCCVTIGGQKCGAL